jgi:hypothetical protein
MGASMGGLNDQTLCPEPFRTMFKIGLSTKRRATTPPLRVRREGRN